MPSFADLGLAPATLEAVAAAGFDTPTAIQAEAIPPLLAGRDITGIAQTGTGKTAAFALPLLETIDQGSPVVQALILAPTRELALQVAAMTRSFARQLGAVKVVEVYGGSPYLPQRHAIADGAQVVVGTPGRIIDLLERGWLDFSAVRFVVLDEADEMLTMGFSEDVDTILATTPPGRQVAMFSATMPPAIRAVAARHLSEPVEIAVSRQSSTVATVDQTYAVVPFKHKPVALARVLAASDADAAIVFVRTRADAETVGLELASRGVSAATISGDVAQKDREKLVARMRSGALHVLVATDVAARGLDIDRVGLVVNYDIPTQPEAYVHRIGRTGRAGRSGTALTFVTPKEAGKLRAIERLTKTTLAEVAIPTAAQVEAHQISVLLSRAANAGSWPSVRDGVAEFAREHEVSLLDLAAALVATQVRRDAGGTEDVGADLDEGKKPSRARRDADGTRYRVDVGSKDGATPSSLVGAITGEAGLRGDQIGRIDLFPRFALVDVLTEISPDQLDRLARARVAGKALRIRLDDGPKSSGKVKWGSGGDRGERSEYPRKPRKYDRHASDRDASRARSEHGSAERSGRDYERADRKPRKPRKTRG